MMFLIALSGALGFAPWVVVPQVIWSHSRSPTGCQNMCVAGTEEMLRQLSSVTDLFWFIVWVEGSQPSGQGGSGEGPGPRKLHL